MDGDGRLCRIVRRRAKHKSMGAVRLGDALSELMERSVSPRQARFGTVSEFLDILLPAELRRHCEIADIIGGQMNVLVDSPAHAYELRLCSSELLERLQRQCPQARIEKIKFVVGRSVSREPDST